MSHTLPLSVSGAGDGTIKGCGIRRMRVLIELYLSGMGYLTSLSVVDCLPAPPFSLWHPNEGIISTSFRP